MRDALEGYEGGIKFGGYQVTNLRYADDTTLICSSREQLVDLLERVKASSEKKGLLLNTKKTKIMVIDKDSDGRDFILDGEKIDEVQQFEYLGSMITTKSDSTTDIKRRLAMARSTTQNMVNIWKSRGLSKGLKLRFLRATVFAIAMYGSESWAMTKSNRKRIDAFEMWCYMRLLRVSWQDKRTNNWVLEKIGSELVLQKSIRERKLRYFGHVIRKEGSLEKQIIQGAVEGRRGRGRPTTAWTDDIKAWNGGSLTVATNLARDRIAWRTLIKTTAAPMEYGHYLTMIDRLIIVTGTQGFDF